MLTLLSQVRPDPQEQMGRLVRLVQPVSLVPQDFRGLLDRQALLVLLAPRVPLVRKVLREHKASLVQLVQLDRKARKARQGLTLW